MLKFFSQEKSLSFVNKLLNMQRFLSYIQTKLKPIFPENEIKAITRLLLGKIAGLNSVQFYGNKDIKISEAIRNKLYSSVDLLVKGEPVQYILGETEFYGLNFKVKPGVLIPRPETEEIIEHILNDLSVQQNFKLPLKILDVGTGSGCIAIALAKNLTNAKVLACDISVEALHVAQENAADNNVSIDFFEVDICSYKPDINKLGNLDIIVSNPPYVCFSEQANMQEHVLNHEPHLALFVNDEDPLLFYRSITSIAVKMLRKSGSLYFEINSRFGIETLNLIQKYPFSKVELFQDIFGRDRIIRAIL
jgi:release factor glutamine methyltransferase